MSTPRWWSQPFPAEGSQTASGIRRQLGRTELDPVNVLVRESVQNSWDARLPGAEPIRVSFSLDRIGTRARTWRDVLLADGDVGPNLGDSDPTNPIPSLKSCLTTGDYVLTISDRRTTGLGGPLRANQPVGEDEVANFVQFIRNVGEPRDQAHGGGTYGFGKSILYSFSRCSTILVRTRCPENEANPKRLMGSALGGTFTDSRGVRHTGRHWWGVVEDDIPDPVLGDEVDRIADALGFPTIDERSGTDVAIIAPLLSFARGEGDEEVRDDPRDLAERIVAAIVWNLWPKLGSASRPRAIEFSVTLDGEEIPIPEPTEIPVVAGLSASLDEVEAMGLHGPGVEERKSAPHVVGALALTRVPARMPSASKLSTAAAPVARRVPFDEPFRHVARMRTAELVVDYLPCAPSKIDALGYMGVYRSSHLADDYFAESEPPTHDSWQPSGLTGTARGVVTNHRTFIKRLTDEFVGGGSAAPSKTVQGLGRLSSTLGSLIDTSRGIAPDKPSGRSPRPSRPKGKKVRVTQPAHVELTEAGPVVRATVEVPEGDRYRMVTAEAHVVIAGGGREKDHPAGVPISEVRGWRRADDPSERRMGENLHVYTSDDAGEWVVEASFVPGASVEITVRQEAL